MIIYNLTNKEQKIEVDIQQVPSFHSTQRLRVFTIPPKGQFEIDDENGAKIMKHSQYYKDVMGRNALTLRPEPIGQEWFKVLTTKREEWEEMMTTPVLPKQEIKDPVGDAIKAREVAVTQATTASPFVPAGAQ